MNIASPDLKYTTQRKRLHAFLLIIGAVLLVSGQALGCPTGGGAQEFECSDPSNHFCVSPDRTKNPRRDRLQYDTRREHFDITPPTIVSSPAPTIGIQWPSSTCETRPDGTCGLPDWPNRPQAGRQVPSFGFSCNRNAPGQCIPVVLDSITPRDRYSAKPHRRQTENRSRSKRGYQWPRAAYPGTAGDQGQRQSGNQIERLKSIWEQHPDFQWPRNGRQPHRK